MYTYIHTDRQIYIHTYETHVYTYMHTVRGYLRPDQQAPANKQTYIHTNL